MKNNEEILIEELKYWKRRCELAEYYIEKNPCDPDITEGQFNAFKEWRNFVESVKRPFITHRRYFDP